MNVTSFTQKLDKRSMMSIVLSSPAFSRRMVMVGRLPERQSLPPFGLCWASSVAGSATMSGMGASAPFAVLHEMNNIGKPVLILHGNHETASALFAECTHLKNMHFIHKQMYIAEDIIFIGYGGGGFSIRDEGFTKIMDDILKEIKELSKKNSKEYRIVLVTHAPPFGTKLDDLGDGSSHVGNQSITEFIIKHQPILAMSGHIHESAGKEDKINMTRVINPGWDGMIIDL